MLSPVAHAASIRPSSKCAASLLSGPLGQLGAVATLSLLGLMLRPREPREIDVTLGGGAVHNQAPHPVDVLRLLGGGQLGTVRATARNFNLMGRDCPGYFSAFIELDDGVSAN